MRLTDQEYVDFMRGYDTGDGTSEEAKAGKWLRAQVNMAGKEGFGGEEVLTEEASQ